MSSNRKKQVQAKAKACILTLEQRLEIIEKLTHQSVAELAREYQVAQSTIWRIKKNEAELLRRKEVIKQSSGSLKKKRYNSVNDSKLEEKLYKWFKQLRSAGVTIDGPLIQQKALEFNEKLSGDPQFQASNGWLCAFKARHRIRELSVQGELSVQDTQQENIGDESMDIDNTDEIPSERENQPIPTALEAYNGISTALRWLCANKEGLAIDIESIKSVRDVIMEKAMLE